MKLKPLHDWAVLVPSTAEERTAGGLFIPDTAKEKPKEGVVEAVGPGAYEEEKHAKKEEQKERKFIPTVVKPGDRVLYESWAGQTVKLGAEERVLVRERSILGLIDRPLQIPSQTSTKSEETGLARYSSSLPAPAGRESFAGTPVEAKPRKAKTAKKKAVKTKSAKKAVKKTVKPAKKSSAKPAKSGKSRSPKAKKSGKKK